MDSYLNSLEVDHMFMQINFIFHYQKKKPKICIMLYAKYIILVQKVYKIEIESQVKFEIVNDIYT